MSPGRSWSSGLDGDPPTDLKPVGASPAVGAGIHVDWITRDYLGTPVADPPDLGAIQH